MSDLLSELSEPIAGITEPAVLNYFVTMNAGDFASTVALFATDGVMYPPFEDGIGGRNAIATYLDAEARGMQLMPKTSSRDTIEQGFSQVQVKGRVQTPLFSVNVAWEFILNPEQKIQAVTIKLLATLEELLPLRQR